MGASNSTVKSVTDVVQEATKDVLSENSSSCSAGGSVAQTMKFKGLKAGNNCNIDLSGISQKAKLEVNLKCIQTQSNGVDLQTSFDSKIKEKIDNSSQAGIGLANASTDTKTKVKQAIKETIKMSSVASCMATAFNKQDLEVSDIQLGDCPNPYLGALVAVMIGIIIGLGLGVAFDWDKKKTTGLALGMGAVAGTIVGFVSKPPGLTIKDIQQEAVTKVAADCMQGQMNDLASKVQAISGIDKDTTSSAKGMDPMGGALIILAIIAAVGGGGLALKK